MEHQISNHSALEARTSEWHNKKSELETRMKRGTKLRSQNKMVDDSVMQISGRIMRLQTNILTTQEDVQRNVGELRTILALSFAAMVESNHRFHMIAFLHKFVKKYKVTSRKMKAS
jgi:hypothetical protein